MQAELGRLIGGEYVLDAPAGSPYNSDSSRRRELRGRADAVVLPGSAEQVAAVVSWCYAHDVPIVARGGGTGLTGGAVPTEGGVVLSLERLRAVRELEPALWRMFPEAGVSTHDVQRLARENGLFFGPDPGASEQSQIGGNVATNAGGPHALKYGVTGAWVTGMEVVLAPGELVQLGGWARKDVAGYDLKDLLIGSEGTLGVITAVRLRLLPAPEAAILLVAFMPTREQGCATMAELLEAGTQPSALEFIDADTLRIVARGYPDAGAGEGSAGVPADAGFALIVEVDGTREQAEAQRRDVLEVLAGEAETVDAAPDVRALWSWRDGFNGVVTAQRGAKVSEDVVFPTERLAEGLARFGEIASQHGLESCAWGHGGEGNVHATVLVDPAERAELDDADAVAEQVFALAISLGGSITGEHGVGWLKRSQLPAQLGDRVFRLQEEIKRVFDPKGLLNPGKKVVREPGRT